MNSFSSDNSDATFLTRVYLNKNLRNARRLLASPHRMHGAVEAAFAPGAMPSGRRSLWRVDSFPGKNILYIVSPVQPDVRHIVEQAGWLHDEGAAETKNYAPLLDRLQTGQSWHFRLTANPVRYLGSKDDTDEPVKRKNVYKRHGHITVAQQLQWLIDKSARCGFQIPHMEHNGQSMPRADIVDRKIIRFERQGGREQSTENKVGRKKTITISTATFEGVLAVTDVDLFRIALRNGIGHAKAYGCGLLTLSKH